MRDILLQQKLAYYIQKKSELESGNYKFAEIEEKVNAYREQLLAEVNEEVKSDLVKIDNYIEVLTELINEATEEESVEETVEETQEEVTEPTLIDVALDGGINTINN